MQYYKNGRMARSEKVRNIDKNNFRDDKDLSKIEMASEGATGCGWGCLGIIFIFVDLSILFNML
ncbi:hypothetical protein JOD44_002846 [Salimicrobium jeotgali]|uniref:hypothetical protein n=1 Tax=Salimicrobium jeotgali TaxID=1230341 RepID=UPI0012E0E534|nr:hypothetical protein [Salimicrobium jeotgali]MBM7697679.1 hypothetical protein [Salimicrobium jeotgali]